MDDNKNELETMFQELNTEEKEVQNKEISYEKPKVLVKTNNTSVSKPNNETGFTSSNVIIVIIVVILGYFFSL